MPVALDLTGQRFGRLVAIKQADRAADGKIQWLCQCDCGNTKAVTGSKLRSGHTSSCGCFRKEQARAATRANLIGQRFGRLTVIADAGSDAKQQALWRCQCDCGNEKFSTTGALNYGEVKSCGCLHADTAAERLRQINADGLRWLGGNSKPRDIEDLSGQVFERLTVLGRAERKDGESRAQWRCRCSCGNETTLSGKVLISGATRSCGCLQKEIASANSRLDLLGQTFGRLQVIKAAGTGGSGRDVHALWLCRCQCGQELTVPSSSLRSGNTRSCGCLHRDSASERRRIDLSGRVFARLTVLEEVGQNRYGSVLWRCQCDCGSETETTTTLLLQGITRSCGCLQRQRASEASSSQLEGMVFGQLTVLERAGSVTFTRGASSLWLCQCTCGATTKVTNGNLKSGGTKSCGCVASGVEQDLVALVRQWLPDAEVLNDEGLGNSRLRYDVIVPEKKVVIEFNGVYWHSALHKDKFYHLDKRELAETAGYRMISVWEDDWRDRPAQVTALLRRVLGLDPLRSIGARKLQIELIQPNEANEHHQAYHMQPAVVRGTLHFGISFEDELLAVASFRQEGRHGHAVIARYTVKPGYTLPGVLPKLLTIVPFDHITSYCDRDYFNGRSYENAGFSLTGTTLQLRYLQNNTRYHRERFMRHRLPALGIEVLPGESGNLALERHGIHACWNSGIDRWEWRRP